MRPTPEEPAGRRLALVLATETYDDPTLAKLRAPGHDASDLAAVLADAAVGGFEVDTLLDAPAELLRRRVAQFCAHVRPGDLALLYLSCHGVLDDRGRLYYATVDTDRTLLSATAVSSTWLNEQLDDCRSRRQILVLDCCHSGAFAKGAKGEGGLALGERFEGRGRVVLTGSRATEYSFERDHVVGDSAGSVFTAALVEGLSSGEADRDGDGLITVGELYDHAYEAVRLRESRQTPTLWTYGAEGDLLVARNPRGRIIRPAPLPEDLLALLESARPRVRAGAVEELADLLRGADAGRALTARARLQRVAAEDVPSVAAAARAILDSEPAPAQPFDPGAGAFTEQPLPQAPTAGDPPSAHRAPMVARPLRRQRRRPTTLIAATVFATGLLTLAIALLVRGGADRIATPIRIAMSRAPYGIAVGEHATWVARHDSDRVSEVDPRSGNPSIAVKAPEKIAAGDGAVWVSAAGGRRLVRIDPRTRQITEERSIDRTCGCAITKLEIAQGALWTSSESDRSISKRDLITGMEIASYAPREGFHGAFAVGDDAIWAVATDSLEPAHSYVIRIDPKSGRVTRKDLGTGSFFNGVAYGAGSVWIADAGDEKNFATAFYPDSQRTADVKIKTGVYDDDIAVVAGTVFVWNAEDGRLTQIDAGKLKIKRSQLMSGFRNAQPRNRAWSDLAVDRNAAWVTDPVGDAVYKIPY